MIVYIKRLAKFLLKLLNAFLGYFLPVVDLRAAKDKLNITKTNLTQPIKIIGSLKMHYGNEDGVMPYWINFFNEGIQLPPVFMITLTDAYLVNRGVILYNNKILLESTIFQREYLNKLLANIDILTCIFKKPVGKLRKAIPLLNKLSNNYYHWTTESLTRLAAFYEHCNNNIENYDIIIAADAPTFVYQSLTALFNVQPERIIRWRNSNKSKLDECILISYPFLKTAETAMTNIYNFYLFNRLNAISLNNISSASEEPEYIIISRAGANQRKLIGDDKILKAFCNIPFKIIHTEKIDFKEQVKLFRNAKLIIAPHGAGLVNVMYCTKKPTVIELFPSTRKIRDASYFFQVSQNLGTNYYLLVKKPVNSNQDIEITDGILSEIENILSLNKY